jgi:hypothetical protein
VASLARLGVAVIPSGKDQGSILAFFSSVEAQEHSKTFFFSLFIARVMAHLYLYLTRVEGQDR